jgi:GNAT superfamily N-acetyltransferase
MTSASYTLVPVDGLGPGDLATLRRIYEDGFPPHLRSEFASLTAGREDSEFALALRRGAQPCGFAMLRRLGPTGWAYLRYFVVDSQLQGQGLGGVMWDLLTARLGADGYTLLIFDVEDPDEPGCDAAERQIRHRRIAFYQRHGAALVPATGYRTPGHHDDDQDWTPMLLMTAPLAGHPAVAGTEQARAIVAAVYRYRWRLAPEHPQVSAVQVGVSPPGGRPGG